MTTLTLSQSTELFSAQPNTSLLATLQLWINRSSQRKHLAMLSNRQLGDIGITREDALKEARLPFWK